MSPCSSNAGADVVGEAAQHVTDRERMPFVVQERPSQAAETAPLPTHKMAAEGPVGPGLSDLVAVAEDLLRQYGITKTFVDILDLDAG
ncbi:hypothetical protein DWB77_00175 [Streptomyces hundungensis]|uniref:Uncharacterized protein n=1 Tax=Streptomyces hundungensis TaxID=1077946 RepID=A0A387HBQ9_9ACTN|nr:hypothetical protein [Streptomyces hundungensis]AYG78068.1 hypothetical protein DWB77_00175 [Streptomyces hundungensis]